MGVILQFKLATYNEQTSKLPSYVIIFQIFWAMFLPNIIWHRLQLGKLSQKKQKGWTYFSIHSVFLQPSQIYEAYSQDIQQINSFWLMKQLHRYQPVVVRFYSILLTKSVIIITAKHWAAVDNRWWLCSWFSCNNC